MSDPTNAPDGAPVQASDNKPAPARKRKPRANAGTSYRALAARQAFSVTDLARARLRKRGVLSDERLSDECKVVRGILRANFAFVRKHDASVRKAKQEANDRRPWPSAMNRHTFGVAVEGKRAK